MHWSWMDAEADREAGAATAECTALFAAQNAMLELRLAYPTLTVSLPCAR